MKRVMISVFVILLSLFIGSVSMAENDPVMQMIAESNQVLTDLNEALLHDPNQSYDLRCVAIAQMMSLMTDGKIGSASELWEIAKAFGFEYQNELSLSENSDILHEFLSIRQKWYAADNHKSIAGFLSAMDKAVNASEELKEMGVAWSYKEGNLDFGFENDIIPQMVEILSQSKELKGITMAEFYDLFMQMARFYNVFW